jgi:hypothetical protein
MQDLANVFSHSWVPTTHKWYLWGNRSFAKYSGCGGSLACWFHVTTRINTSPEASTWDRISSWDFGSTVILDEALSSESGFGQDLIKNGVGIDCLPEDAIINSNFPFNYASFDLVQFRWKFLPLRRAGWHTAVLCLKSKISIQEYSCGESSSGFPTIKRRRIVNIFYHIISNTLETSCSRRTRRINVSAFWSKGAYADMHR